MEELCEAQDYDAVVSSLLAYRDPEDLRIAARYYDVVSYVCALDESIEGLMQLLANLFITVLRHGTNDSAAKLIDYWNRTISLPYPGMLDAIASNSDAITRLCAVRVDDWVELLWAQLVVSVFKAGTFESLQTLITAWNNTVPFPWTRGIYAAVSNNRSALLVDLVRSKIALNIFTGLRKENYGETLLSAIDADTIRAYCQVIDVRESEAVLLGAIQTNVIETIRTVINTAPVQFSYDFEVALSVHAAEWCESTTLVYLLTPEFTKIIPNLKTLFETSEPTIIAMMVRPGPCLFKYLGLDPTHLARIPGLMYQASSLDTAEFLDKTVPRQSLFDVVTCTLYNFINDTYPRLPPDLVMWLCRHPVFRRDTTLRETWLYLSQFEEYRECANYIEARARRLHNSPLRFRLYLMGLGEAIEGVYDSALERMQKGELPLDVFTGKDGRALARAIIHLTERRKISLVQQLITTENISLIGDSDAVEIFYLLRASRCRAEQKLFIERYLSHFGGKFEEVVVQSFYDDIYTYCEIEGCCAGNPKSYWRLLRHRRPSRDHQRAHFIATLFEDDMEKALHEAISMDLDYRVMVILFRGGCHKISIQTGGEEKIDRILQVAYGRWSPALHVVVGGKHMKGAMRALFTAFFLTETYLPYELRMLIATFVRMHWFRCDNGYFMATMPVILTLYKLWDVLVPRSMYVVNNGDMD